MLANKSSHLAKMALSFQMFIRNRSVMLSSTGDSASRASPMHFASSISLEQAVTLVFCKSELDLDSELGWAFEFIVFVLELDWQLGVSRTSPSGIDAALVMSVICVLCTGKSNRLQLVKITIISAVRPCLGPGNAPSQVIP